MTATQNLMISKVEESKESIENLARKMGYGEM